MTTHHGAHLQGGKGHISHWAGVPEDMKGLWEMPLTTFIGEAAVCNLKGLEPRAIADPSEYPLGAGMALKSREGDVRGQEIKPEHLGNVHLGDIVLMTSPFTGLEQPWLSHRHLRLADQRPQDQDAGNRRTGHRVAVRPESCRRRTTRRSGGRCSAPTFPSPIRWSTSTR